MTIRRWTLVSTLVATLAVPATALAQSAPPPAPIAAIAAATSGNDEVVLNNGGMLRGTVVSVEPGKEVAILVQGTTDVRHLAWADVAQVNRGKYAAMPPPLPPPPFPGTPVMASALGTLGYTPVSTLPPPAPGELGAPRLHIETPTPVTLHETLDTDLGRERPIDCQSPCDKVIDGRAGQAFYFAGDEIPQSARFHLTEKSGDVTARVSPGNRGVRTAGAWLIGLGITGVTAGAITLPIGMAMNSGAAPGQSSSTVPMAGGVTLGIGAAMLLSGIVMNVVGHTRYDFSTAQTAAVPGGFAF